MLAANCASGCVVAKGGESRVVLVELAGQRPREVRVLVQKGKYLGVLPSQGRQIAVGVVPRHDGSSVRAGDRVNEPGHVVMKLDNSPIVCLRADKVPGAVGEGEHIAIDSRKSQ